MDRPASRTRVAWWTATIALGLLLAAGTVLLASIWPPQRAAPWGFTGFQGILSLAIGSMGAVVVYRRPSSRAGWVLLATGVAGAVQYVLDVIPPWVFQHWGPGSSAEVWASWLSNAAWVPTVSLLGYLLIIFPDGRPPTPRWSIVTWLLAAAAASTMITASLVPGGLYNYPDVQNPVGIPGLPADLLLALGYPFYMSCLGAAAASMVARWRRAQREERAQLKWFALAGVPFALATMLSVTSREAQYAAIGFGALIPVAVAVAILRNHLYDIDRIISRSIGWALVSAALGLAFVGLVLVLQALLAGITQGQTLAVAASTLVAFAIFQPLRRRVQEAVDRRFDRSRYDAEMLVEGFAGQLRSEVDLPSVRRNLTATTARAVHPVSVGVWMRDQDGEPAGATPPEAGRGAERAPGIGAA